uniref:Uncharacterized protein n=1 Tax=Anguilla anguilla TaxID=7936 RepID=A0A0E9RQC5_ANGAN
MPDLHKIISPKILNSNSSPCPGEIGAHRKRGGV